jgi:cytochrome c peroxidase
MRRLDSLAWVLGSVMAVSAALVVTFAHAAPRNPAPGADRWSADELAVLASLSLKRLEPVPIDPSNAVERQPAAVELGRRLFNDARFSGNGAVSCASCHDSQKQFQDGLPVSRGVGTGSRRAMPIVGSGYSHWLFWDGRKDSLWAQALGPLEDAVEHGGNRTRHAQLVVENYRKEYEDLFKAVPSFEGLPRDAGPNGSMDEIAAWTAMDVRRREDVSRVFANMGKAIAAYEKSLRHEPTRLDRYLDAVARRDPAARDMLQDNEVRGLGLFIGKAQCVTCHNGPLFTDQQFHNTGVPPRDAAKPDRGRAAATAKVRGDEFNCLGPFSDAAPKQCQELRFMVSDDAALEGAFKTPGLRGVAERPPYMHAGQFTTLEQVVRHYVAAPHAAVGHSELKHRHASASASAGAHAERAPIELSDAEVADLVSFLGTLSADRPSATAVPRTRRLEESRASSLDAPHRAVSPAGPAPRSPLAAGTAPAPGR